jgi:hypothetical protein
MKGSIMKHFLTATTALLALSAQAQVSGPNRPGPGSSPGTFQTPSSSSSSIQVTTPDSANISVAPRTPNPDLSPVPQTSLGTPDASGGALTDSLRSRSSFPSSRNAETGASDRSALDQNEIEARRLTPLPDITPPLQPINPPLQPIQGAGSTIRGTTPNTANPAAPFATGTNASGAASTTVPPPMPSDLNTTGINTPPRVPEQPLDQALSAKLRAQLSQTPRSGAARLSPETIRDLRITSQGGKVILEGNVMTLAQKQLVENQARQIPGVVAVENRLNIRETAVGSPATGQTGQGQLNPSRSQLDHPEISPDF